jgi:hypothetical protein
MTREEFEARKQNRIDRMHRLAVKARELSDQYNRASDNISSGIPFGQPILIGHHSEKRHRRMLERMHRYTDKSIEEYRKAQYYDRRASNAESNNAISSDDPDAIQKLKNKVASLEKNQEIMRAANKIIRKGNTPENIAALVALGLSAQQAEESFKPDFCGRIGFADYQLSNNNANIRRIKERIAYLERSNAKPTIETEENGIRFVDNSEANRYQIFFNGKPKEEIRSLLKHRGFRWSPTNGAWQRFRKNNWHNEDDKVEVLKLIAQ